MEAAADEYACFKKGAQVEVSFEEEGFRGSWYTATVLRPPSKKNSKLFLQFHTLMTDNDDAQEDHHHHHRNKKSKPPSSSMPLQEYVDPVLVRPVPPRESRRSFQVSDEVDAFHNDGWWEGIVIHVFPLKTTTTSTISETTARRYSVFFRCSREQIDFPETDLRLHREWVHGKWQPPLAPAASTST